nr:MAG TPA: hypothetical protein [Caudoviricetes sp.]
MRTKLAMPTKMLPANSLTSWDLSRTRQSSSSVRPPTALWEKTDYSKSSARTAQMFTCSAWPRELCLKSTNRRCSCNCSVPIANGLTS